MTPRCANCAHHPHAGACRVQRVTGPAVDNVSSRAHLHEGRTVTPCECKTYVPNINGTERNSA